MIIVTSFLSHRTTTLNQSIGIASDVESTMHTPPAGQRPNSVTRMSDQFIGATSKDKQFDEDESAKKDMIKGSYQNVQNRSNNSHFSKPFVYIIFSALVIGVMGTIVI